MLMVERNRTLRAVLIVKVLLDRRPAPGRRVDCDTAMVNPVEFGDATGLGSS
jgi:hypothetical protein